MESKIDTSLFPPLNELAKVLTYVVITTEKHYKNTLLTSTENL